MGIEVVDEIVSSVGAILKTLECPICLELLKKPVSAGCGHFFCKLCATGILQSKYRAPCPLCKRSFTRRSVQAASQRQSVISAARTLAQTCSSLTGSNFTALDSFVKEASRSEGPETPVPSKKFRVSDEKEAKNAPSRKRKSVETEDAENTKWKSLSDTEMETHVKPLQDDETSKKRVCPNIESEDSEDLPPLSEVFIQHNPLSKSSAISVINETAVKKPLSIFPTDRMSTMKTYSSIHRKKDNSASNIGSKSKEKEGYDDYFISNKKNVASEIGSHGIVQMKNKINALKNKTNEVHTEKLIQDDDIPSKSTNVKNLNEKMEPMDKSKENEIVSSSPIPANALSPAKLKQPCIKKLRKSKRKSQTQLQNSSASKNVSSNQEHKNCYTLDEVPLSLEWKDQNEQITCNKPVEDPFKSMGLTDTAISVDSVGSPLAAKALSFLKSPGWSRVKEVKKDFKVKKFTSLHVEKNSPVASLKSTVVHCQEPNSLEDDLELSSGIQKDRDENKIDSACENEVMEKHTAHLPVCGSKMDQESGQEFNLNEEENNTVDDGSVSQNVNVPECINLDDVNESDSHMEVDKQIDVTSKHNVNNLKNILNINSLKNNVAVAENIGIAKLPTMSITSNSVICANYADTRDKISKHNIVKTKNIICEIPNNTFFTNDTPKSGNILSKYIQDNCSEADSTILNNPAELKEGIFPLPSQISGYQSIQAHSVINEDDGFQYVEQSQQTSQMFNFDLQNSVLNKLNSIIEPQVIPNHTTREKTKVVKRTCLTLEEIQECFLKSSQSNCSETLCSVPFLDGLFKLHIGVSDDTLNVSVLRVIEPSSDIHNAQSALLSKYIQTSNSVLLPAILPSSNTQSESSQPESGTNPFPYLNKDSRSMTSNQDLPHAVEISFPQNEPSNLPNRTNNASETSTRMVDQSNCVDEIIENNMDMSEIIHFPPESTPENEELFQKCPEFVDTVQQAEVVQAMKSPMKEDEVLTIEQSPLKTDHASMEHDLHERNCKNLLSNENDPILLDSEEFSNSDEEESLKKLEKCVHQAPKGGGKKVSRLSLKKKSFRRTQVLESSDESDIENLGLINKSVTEVGSKDSPKPDKPLKHVSPAENMCSSRILGKGENLKTTAHQPVTGDTPSTLNSILSEDTADANASEIILEIEDLSDKIKSLEDKLKQCGHTDLQKSLSLPRPEGSKPETSHENTDSEDSFDLFPQSVPPTPPTRV